MRHEAKCGPELAKSTKSAGDPLFIFSLNKSFTKPLIIVDSRGLMRYMIGRLVL